MMGPKLCWMAEAERNFIHFTTILVGTTRHVEAGFTYMGGEKGKGPHSVYDFYARRISIGSSFHGL